MKNEEIEHIAKLARLKLNDSEEVKFTQEIGAILNYIDELEELKNEEIEPISQIANLKNITRQDEITNQNNRENLLSNAPEKNNGFIKVKQVFE